MKLTIGPAGKVKKGSSQYLRERSVRANVEYLYCIVLLLCAYSVYFKASTAFSAIFEFVLIGVGGVLVLLTSTRGKKLKSESNIVYGFLIFEANILVIMLLLLVDGGDNIMSYVLQRIALLAIIVPEMVVLLRNMGTSYIANIFVKRFTNCLAVLCIIALPIWVLNNIGIISPNMSFSYQWGGDNSSRGFFGLIFNCQPSEVIVGGHTWWRFTLFFVEGPSATFVFLFALMMELFIAKSPRLWVSSVLIVASLCSLTTQGLIMTPLILVCWLIQSKEVQKKIRMSSIYVFLFYCVIAVLTIVLPLWIMYTISSKKNVGSSQAHSNDFQYGLISFLDKPFFGHGIGNYENAYAQYKGGDAGQTSGFMSSATQGGILLLLCYLVPFLLLFWHAYRRSSKSLAFLAFIMFIFYLASLVDNNPLFGFFIALCLSLEEKGSVVLQRNKGCGGKLGHLGRDVIADW
jgi:hypothetical protein